MTRACLLLLALSLATGCALSPDPDKRNLALMDLEPRLPISAITVLAELPEPPGNIAVAAGGRVFFTFHPEAAPTLARVAELLPGGRWKPYPDAAWQTEREGKPFFRTPLAVRVDVNGWLWVLDHGDYGSDPPSLTAFDTATGALAHRHVFASDVANWGSMLNDFAVDAQRGVVFIADTSPFDFDPAIIVYDIKARRGRRVLENHLSVKAADHHAVVQGVFMKAFGLPLQLGVDSITLSKDGAWLYYGPLSGGWLYRAPATALRDAALSEDDLAAKVEAFARKPTSDGIACDAAGRIYLTAVEHDAIAVVSPDRQLSVLVQDPLLLAWPDGVEVGPDGEHLYVTCSQLHRVIGQDRDEALSKGPFRILKIPLPPPPR